MKTDQAVTVKLTAAIAINGVIHPASSIVTIGDSAAKNLLYRGKAELATADDEQLAAVVVEADDEDSAGPKPADEQPAVTTAKKK